MGLKYPVAICMECGEECERCEEVETTTTGTIELWCWCEKCEIDTFHPIPKVSVIDSMNALRRTSLSRN